jgi:Hemerythrin HHE cation binding domain
MQSRVSVYSAAHKGLRLGLFRALSRAGALDVTNGESLRAFGEEVERVLLMLRAHQRDEDTHLKPLVERHAGAAARTVAQEHRDHTTDLEHLERLTERLLTVETREERSAVAQGLFTALDRFTADYLDHLRHEEQTIQPLLWMALSDAQLQEVVEHLRASIPSDERRVFLAYMLPAVNPEERTQLLGGLQLHPPSRAFDPVVELATQVLDVRGWTVLQKRVAVR